MSSQRTLAYALRRTRQRAGVTGDHSDAFDHCDALWSA
jgi:hypothetical protein